MKNKSSYFVVIGYFISVIALFLYSYIHVDLNLTLSRASFVQSLQKSFQYIGFYNRPLSAVVYIGIITLFYLLYFQVLSLVKNKSIDRKKIWKIIYILVAVLIFSYPAFLSYDFFNYMFTAKTILVYHKNPYEITPLMFAGIDPWLNFMRWTHLSSAYTPLWIFFSLIPYLLGFGYFIPIMVNMKLLIALFYILACVMVEKILKREKPTEAAFGLALFALNPLIIVEALASSHNDIVLSAFALVSLWYLSRKRVVSALFWLSVSIAAKFMTIMLIPLYAFKKRTGWMLVAMIVGLVIVILKREFLPWYLVWVMPFVALEPSKKSMYVAFSILSYGMLLSYVPYLYIGSYTPYGQQVKTTIIIVSIISSIISFFVFERRRGR